MSSNKKKKKKKKREPVKVNPAGDKTFYEQGGGEGLSPNLFTKPSTWWKKKNLYTHFSTPSLFTPFDINYLSPFQKKKKKKVRMDFTVKPRVSPRLDACQSLLCDA